MWDCNMPSCRCHLLLAANDAVQKRARTSCYLRIKCVVLKHNPEQAALTWSHPHQHSKKCCIDVRYCMPGRLWTQCLGSPAWSSWLWCQATSVCLNVLIRCMQALCQKNCIQYSSQGSTSHDQIVLQHGFACIKEAGRKLQHNPDSARITWCTSTWDPTAFKRCITSLVSLRSHTWACCWSNFNDVGVQHKPRRNKQLRPVLVYTIPKLHVSIWMLQYCTCLHPYVTAVSEQWSIDFGLKTAYPIHDQHTLCCKQCVQCSGWPLWAQTSCRHVPHCQTDSACMLRLTAPQNCHADNSSKFEGLYLQER